MLMCKCPCVCWVSQSVWERGERLKAILKSRAAYFPLILQDWEVLWLQSLVTVPLSPSPSVSLFSSFLSLLHGKEIRHGACKQKETKLSLWAACCLRDQQRDKSVKSSDHLCVCVCVRRMPTWANRDEGRLTDTSVEENSHITAGNLRSCSHCPLFSLANYYINAENQI